jgi:hypothetical protein
VNPFELHRSFICCWRTSQTDWKENRFGMEPIMLQSKLWLLVILALTFSHGGILFARISKYKLCARLSRIDERRAARWRDLGERSQLAVRDVVQRWLPRANCNFVYQIPA